MEEGRFFVSPSLFEGMIQLIIGRYLFRIIRLIVVRVESSFNRNVILYRGTVTDSCN